MQRKHNLYRDSMVMHNSDPNLHLLGEGMPIDWGEEFGSQPDSDPSAEKRHRARQVVSVIHDDEGALSYEAGAEVLMHQVSQEELGSEELEACPALAAPGSPDSMQGIRGMLVKEFCVETPVPAREEAKEPLTNGTIVQQSGGSEEHGVERAAQKAEEGPGSLEHSAPHDAGSPCPVNPGVEEQEAKPAVPTSPAKPPALTAASLLAEGGVEVNRHEPSDKETGEEVSTQAHAEKVESAQPATENSAGATENSAEVQTQF